jgi:hypothetical protein
VRAPAPRDREPFELVWTLAYVLDTRRGFGLDADVVIGFEPHEVVTRTATRLAVRSLTTGRHRVLRPTDLV